MLKLSYPFSSVIIQRQNVIIYEKPDAKFYLLGTNHVSKQSIKAIKELISEEEPDVVTVELCLERLENVNLLTTGREWRKKYHDLLRIPMNIRRKAVGELTRLLIAHQALESNTSLRKNHSDRYQVRPIDLDGIMVAGDVFTPFGNSTWILQSNCSNYLFSPEASYKIVLADMPISNTYAKLVKVFSDEEKNIIRTYRRDFVDEFTKNKNGIMGRIWYSNENVRKIVLDERDEYLANSIVKAAKISADTGKKRVVVVAIVGRKHVNGILRKWKSQRYL